MKRNTFSRATQYALLVVVAVAISVAVPDTCNAGLVVDVTEVGDDLQFVVSGSLDFSGWRFAAPISESTVLFLTPAGKIPGQVEYGGSTILRSGNYDLWDYVDGFTLFGDNSFNEKLTHDGVGNYSSPGDHAVGWTNNLSATATDSLNVPRGFSGGKYPPCVYTITSQSFDSTGIEIGDSWGAVLAGSNDTIVFNAIAVPEPSSGLILEGAFLVAFLLRRRLCLV